MRIISQNGKFDFPYESSSIEKFDGSKYIIKVNGKVFAEYNSESERVAQIEELWVSYGKGEKMFKFK